MQSCGTAKSISHEPVDRPTLLFPELEQEDLPPSIRSCCDLLTRFSDMSQSQDATYEVLYFAPGMEALPSAKSMPGSYQIRFSYRLPFLR